MVIKQCGVKTFESSLPRLEFLDLSDNLIEMIPDLNLTPMLSQLCLNSNCIRIVDIRLCSANMQRITSIELTNNPIEFDENCLKKFCD
jgi:Leucine-rich repeat (LRR) protein